MPSGRRFAYLPAVMTATSVRSTEHEPEATTLARNESE
jgi:hypothetical protein